jgi:hypothetical protein
VVASTTTNRALTQYSGDTPSDLFIRDVPDWFETIKRQDTPLIQMFSSTGAPDTPMHKAEFGWSSPDPVQDTITEPIVTTPAAGSLTTVTPANIDYWSVGRILLIDNEQMTVESLGATTAVVARGHAGTTVATHVDNSVVDFLAPALKELEDDPLSPITQGEIDFNYHQIMSFSWELSKWAEVTPTYESRSKSGDRSDQELRKKMEYTAPLALERQLLFGQRALGSTATRPSLGGLYQSSFISTRTSLSSNPLTEYDLMTNLQVVWQLVGGDDMGKTIMTDMLGKRIVNSWYNDTRRSGTGDSKISVNWDTIETDMGTFNLRVNWQMNNRAKLYVLNGKDFKRRPYASSTGWQRGKLATQGWYSHGFLRGSFTLIPHFPDSRLELHTWSTTAGDYPGLA